jgi:hypothetical protein
MMVLNGMSGRGGVNGFVGGTPTDPINTPPSKTYLENSFHTVDSFHPNNCKKL